LKRPREFKAKELNELEPGFCNWFSGLVDGEGSLQIKHWNNQWWLELTIKLRDDDRPLIEYINREMGRGRCYVARNVSPPEHNSKSGYMIRFHNSDDTRFFVDFFKKYPLRSKKNLVFKIWADARKELDKPFKMRDQEYLKYLYEAIRKTRKYTAIAIEKYESIGKQLSLSLESEETCRS
jgi:hypothetical protein